MRALEGHGMKGTVLLTDALAAAVMPGERKELTLRDPRTPALRLRVSDNSRALSVSAPASPRGRGRGKLSLQVVQFGGLRSGRVGFSDATSRHQSFTCDRCSGFLSDLGRSGPASQGRAPIREITRS
jgi:hypothetical protein